PGSFGLGSGRGLRRKPKGGSGWSDPKREDRVALSAALGKGSSMATLNQYLKLVVERGGSDLHLKAGHPPVIRVHGALIPAEAVELKPADIERMAREIMPDNGVASFETTGGADFAHYVKGLGRFRVNVFKQSGV